jgi:ABC-type amino acid transport substrate-binding protein
MDIAHRMKWLLVAFVAAFAVLAMACGDDADDDDGSTGSSQPPAQTFPAGSTMDTIAKRGKIIIGVKYDVPLFGLQDPVSRRVDGFDVALGKEIAKALGLQESQVEFVEAITANRIPFLLEDKADLVISTFTINDMRKEQIDFSRPYFKAGQSILVKRENTTIRTYNDLAGKGVCSQAGSTSENNIKAMAPQAQLLTLPAIAACVQAMKDGRVEAVSTDDVQLSAFAVSDNTLKLVGGQFSTELYGVGIKKGKQDLVTFVNDVIAKMLQDGRWEKMYTDYLGKVEGMPPAATAKAALPPTS